MPELPEVETVVRTLRTQIIGRKIISSTLLYPRVIKTPNLSLQSLTDHTFQSIDRKGKFLIFNLDSDLHIVLHLRMEGKIFYLPSLPVLEKAISFYLELDRGYLVFQDTRKFGVAHIYQGTAFYSQEPLNKVGLDPFKIDSAALYQLYIQEKGFLKETLLNQELMSGIGNIYADEVLFAAQLSPFMSPKDLTKEDVENILRQTQKIMNKSIELGGSTVRSYLSSEGHAGSFQSELKVYSHAGKPCSLCHTKLEKRFVGGRGTTFCRHCQHIGLTIGITGLIGTGKSTVVKNFIDAGFALYDCDQKVAGYYEDQDFISATVAKFSPVFDDEFSKVRALDTMIKDASFRRRYESHIYHRIEQDLLNFLNHHFDENIVVEAPRLFEAHLEKYLSYIIAVTSPESLIRERLKLRSAANCDDLLQLNKKSALSKKINSVDFILENDSTIEDLNFKTKAMIEDILKKNS